MPFIGGIIAGVVGAVAGLGAIGKAILSVVLTVGLGFVAKALAPKPKAPEFEPPSIPQSDRTQMVRQPMQPRRIIIGEVKVGSVLTFIDSSDDTLRHRIITTLCDGPIDGIPVVWFNDQPIYEDQIAADGKVISGPYENKAWIVKYLGEEDQASNPNLPVGFSGKGVAYIDVYIEWDVDTYPTGLPDVSAEVRGMKFIDTRDDTTLLVPRFSMNPSMALRAVLNGRKWWGLWYEDAAFLPDYFNAAANTCDEFVTSATVVHTVASVDIATNTFKLAGAKLQFQTGDRVRVNFSTSVPTGTPDPAYVIIVRSRNRKGSPTWEVGIDEDTPEKLEIKLASSYANALAGVAVALSTAGSGTGTITKDGEPRYSICGVIDSPVNEFTEADKLVRAMGGRAVYSGGIWRVVAGAYITPEFELTERHLIAPAKIQTRVSGRDRFNSMRGSYFNPLNDWQPSDYPHVRMESWISDDGGEPQYSTLDLPYTTRAQTAQRLAAIEINRMRGNEITLEVVTTLHALEVQAGENILVTLPEFGFDEKPFEITSWTLSVETSNDSSSGSDEEIPVLAIRMVLRETQPSVFGWTASDEAVVVPIPRSNLINAWKVPAPISIYARTQMITTLQGDTVYTAYLSWGITPMANVDRGGSFEIQTRRSSGGALHFDGGNDYVEFGTINLSSTDGWCIEMIAQNDGEDSPPQDHGLFTNGQVSIFRRQADALIQVNIFNVDFSATPVTLVSTTQMLLNDIVHIAVLDDTEHFSLIINGVVEDFEHHSVGLARRVTMDGDVRITQDGDTRILTDIHFGSPILPQLGRGRDQTVGTAYFHGIIDEFRIWNGSVRTLDEIIAMLDETAVGREDHLLGSWSADVAIVDQLIDSTPNANTGTIVGATYVDGFLASGWEPSWFVDGLVRLTALPMLSAGQIYDIRIRTVNAHGIHSPWSTIANFTVGSIGGATDQEDWGSIAAAPDSPVTDWGSIADSPAADEDWGSVV